MRKKLSIYNQGKIVHILTNDKFIDQYIKFVNDNFSSKKHLFIIRKTNENYKIDQRENTILIENSFHFIIEILFKINNFDKIILHSLQGILVPLLILKPLLLKRCLWVIWGGDLYSQNNENRKLINYMNGFIKKIVVKNLGGYITPIKGDFELVKRLYQAKGQYYYSFVYPSNLYKEYNCIRKQDDTTKIYIQIGNSADPSNNHKEVIDKLKKYKWIDIEIICPLSYGNKAYAREVIEYGERNFGQKFSAITDFVPIDEYLDILSKVDIAIFNHRRQQAMGNIITLLGLGKKVYIRDDITTWNFCIDHDLQVYRSNYDFDDLFEEMGESLKQKNIDNVKRMFSKKKLVDDLSKIFN